MTKQILFRFLIIILFPFQTINAQWEKLNGPFGGAILNIVENDSLLFIAGPSSGIFVSSDTGRTWQQRINGMEDISVYGLAISDSLIIAGTADGLYISIDNGLIWILCSSLGTPQIQDVIFLGDTIIAATSSGLLMSSDFGLNWTDIGANLPGTNQITYRISSIGNRLFTVNLTNVLLASDNFGQSWDSIQGLPSSYLYDFLISENLIFVNFGSSLYSSSDTGTTWQIIDTTGLPSPLYAGLIGYSDSTLYLSNSNNIFYKSDTSISWIEIPDLQSAEANYISKIKESLFACSGISGIYSMSSNDTIWKISNEGITSVEIRDIISVNNNLFAVCEGIGLQHSSDNGNSWNKITNGLPGENLISLIYKDNIIFCGSRDNGLYQSIDQGLNWVRLNNNGIPVNNWIDEFMIHDSKLYAATNSGLYYTNDNGSNWSRILQTSISTLGSNTNYIYAGASTTTNLDTYSSNDNGTNWGYAFTSSMLPGSFGYGVNDIITCNDSILFLATISGILQSNNYGSNWNFNSINGEIISLLNYGNNIFAGARRDVYISTDYGNSWTITTNDVPNITPRNITEINDTIYICTAGNGIFRTAASALTLFKNEIFETNSIEIYPNPATSKVTIKSNKFSEKSDVTIYNVIGEIIYFKKEANLNLGLSIQIESASKGLYFVRINDAKNIVSLKLIIN